MSNKKVGNIFEQELCSTLYKQGFWCHNMAQTKSGQPADIIAVKEGRAFLIDAKVCTNDKFALSRVEENQTLAMGLWEKFGNGTGWFAIKMRDEIFMLSNTRIQMLKKTHSQLSYTNLSDNAIRLGDWLWRY